MKKSFWAKVFFIGTMGCLSLVLGVNDVEAASFESMKEHVEAGEGLVFNPVSEGIMTKESSLEYIEIIEEEKNEEDVEEVTEQMMDEAFEKTKTLKVLPKEVNYKPSIQPRGANVPGHVTYIDDIPAYRLPHPSNPFSAAGWRYSETRYAFRNLGANPYFAVRASLDSFYFHTAFGKFVIPANRGFVYYDARSAAGYGLQGYFSTYNPVNGCRYYIY